jgi:hypothetical protein
MDISANEHLLIYKRNTMSIYHVLVNSTIHSPYSYDPNGIPAEFSHDVKGVDVREHPKMSDLAPSVVTQEGSEP